RRRTDAEQHYSDRYARLYVQHGRHEFQRYPAQRQRLLELVDRNHAEPESEDHQQHASGEYERERHGADPVESKPADDDRRNGHVDVHGRRDRLHGSRRRAVLLSDEIARRQGCLRRRHRAAVRPEYQSAQYGRPFDGLDRRQERRQGLRSVSAHGDLRHRPRRRADALPAGLRDGLDRRLRQHQERRAQRLLLDVQKLLSRVAASSDSRNILTLDDTGVGSKVKPFAWASLTATEQAFFANKCTPLSTMTQCALLTPAQQITANDGNQMVGYLRGWQA